MKNKPKLERIAMHEMAMLEFVLFLSLFTYYCFFLILKPVGVSCCVNEIKKSDQIICRRKIEKKTEKVPTIERETVISV